MGGAGCFGQIAKDSKPGVFQFSAAGGFPSRETQVKGALHHYVVSSGTYHYDRASFPGGTPYSNHYSLSIHYEQTFWSTGRWSSCYFLEEGFGYTEDCFDPVSNPESTYGGAFPFGSVG